MAAAAISRHGPDSGTHALQAPVALDAKLSLPALNTNPPSLRMVATVAPASALITHWPGALRPLVEAAAS